VAGGRGATLDHRADPSEDAGAERDERPRGPAADNDVKDEQE
jgi:hypothetical protein